MRKLLSCWSCWMAITIFWGCKTRVNLCFHCGGLFGAFILRKGKNFLSFFASNFHANKVSQQKLGALERIFYPESERFSVNNCKILSKSLRGSSEIFLSLAGNKALQSERGRRALGDPGRRVQPVGTVPRRSGAGRGGRRAPAGTQRPLRRGARPGPQRRPRGSSQARAGTIAALSCRGRRPGGSRAPVPVPWGCSAGGAARLRARRRRSVWPRRGRRRRRGGGGGGAQVARLRCGPAATEGRSCHGHGPRAPPHSGRGTHGHGGRGTHGHSAYFPRGSAGLGPERAAGAPGSRSGDAAGMCR